MTPDTRGALNVFFHLHKSDPNNHGVNDESTF